MTIPREYLARIGARGGRKSRRTLDPAAAREMVRVREAGRAYRRFHSQCFAEWPSTRRITASDIEWVAELLVAHGDEAARAKAAKLCPITLVENTRPQRPIRYDMTARILPLRSAEAAVAYVPGTVADRFAIMKELSAIHWKRTGRPTPTYTRASMPIAIRPLRDPRDLAGVE